MMGQITRGLGYVMLVLAAFLAVIGASAWPPGGLMFALPFVFILPAVLLALIGGALLWHGRRTSAGRR